MIVSVAEFGVLLVRRYGLGRVMYQGADVIWTKPLVNLLIFHAGGVSVLLASRFRPQVGMRLALTLFVFLASAAPLLQMAAATRIPVLILELGLGVRLGALMTNPVWTRRAMIAGQGSAVALALAALTMRSTGPGASSGADGDAVSAESPNVLLVILDSMRATSLELYGKTRAASPQLEALAICGVTFERAVAPSPGRSRCMPRCSGGCGRANIWLSGVSPRRAGAHAGRGLLASRGCDRGGRREPHLRSARARLQRGFQVYRDHQFTLTGVLRSASLTEQALSAPFLRRRIGRYDVPGRKYSASVNREFLAWQPSLGDRPFLAFLSYFDAHESYLPKPPFLPDAPPMPCRYGGWTCSASGASRVAHSMACPHSWRTGGGASRV